MKIYTNTAEAQLRVLKDKLRCLKETDKGYYALLGKVKIIEKELSKQKQKDWLAQ